MFIFPTPYSSLLILLAALLAFFAGAFLNPLLWKPFPL
jgi:hypothetical protein